MRFRPNQTKEPATARVWMIAGLAGTGLAIASVALAGQSPAAQQAAPAQAAPANQVPASQAAASPGPANTKPAEPAQAAAAPATAQNATAPNAGGQPPAQTMTLAAGPAAAVPTADQVENLPLAQQTADLVLMATDLQDELDKTRPATLSLAVVRKANAIEQLAKKMKAQP